MALLKYFKKFERKFAWSFFGVVLALIFGGITVYREFIEDKRPALQYDILTNTSVLDVKEQLSNLSVLFDGIDIRKQGLSLRVITVRVLNHSSRDILKGHYDDKAPLGLHISTGKVIRTELVDASNEYLRKNFTIEERDDQTLHFPSVILEAGESFALKLLVLHPEGQIPTLNAVGKVAGIQVIPVREAFRDDGKEPFFAAAFQGTFLVQIIRLLAYTIGTILLLAAIIVPIAMTSSKLDERKKKKTVQEFKGITNLDLNESDEFIFTQYVQWGGHMVRSMNSLVSDADVLATTYANYQEHKMQDPAVETWFGYHRIEDYLAAGLVRKTDEGLTADKHLTSTIEHFLRFLRNKGLISSEDERTEEAEPEISPAEGKARGA